MLRSVLLKTLRDQRRSLLWWGLGLVATAVILMLFYPSVRDATVIEQYIEALPKELMALFAGEITDYTSPEGFLNAELFFFMAPLLFMIFAIAMGSGAIAGEEERGTLDLLLSNPLARWRVVVEKFGAMVIATLVLAFVFWAGLAVGARAINMEISLLRLGEACLSALLLGLAFGAVALALGCATGKRSLSIGVASALGVATYFLNALAPIVEMLEPYREASPFYYYIGADPLSNGLNPGHAGILIGLAPVFLVVALVTFQRRDLRL